MLKKYNSNVEFFCLSTYVLFFPFCYRMKKLDIRSRRGLVGDPGCRAHIRILKIHIHHKITKMQQDPPVLLLALLSKLAENLLVRHHGCHVEQRKSKRERRCLHPNGTRFARCHLRAQECPGPPPPPHWPK
jgi:hypothetical protein